MGFEERLQVSSLRPAEYNPREIDPDTLDRLKTSIQEVGFIKPVVARADGLLIAGHQRTKAAAALGIQHVPGHIVPVEGIADEIRFNQLHNGCEVDLTDALVRVAPGQPGTWAERREIDAPERLGDGAAARQEMLRLLTKYGPFAGCVALPDGEVIAGQAYAWCCKITGRDLHVRYVESGAAPAVREHLSAQYGRYSYRHLPKTTWVQSLAQMSRLEGASQLRSTLYERCVIPSLSLGERILDFGCGKGAYVRSLRSVGHDILGVEFYARKRFSIDTKGGHAQIDALLADLASRGRFDVVVCDSVLNSVDSPEAERHVLGAVNALCRPGGRIYLSGRPLERLRTQSRTQKISDHHRRYIEFIDDDGFTAIFRHGAWHYQKFHDRAAVEAIGARYIGPGCTITCSNTASKPKAHLNGTSWQLQGVKSVEMCEAERAEAIAREFDLPLPTGSYGRSSEALAALRSALALES